MAASTFLIDLEPLRNHWRWLIALGIAGRILGEEKMLAEELEGYSDYRKKVRYRLIPHVW